MEKKFKYPVVYKAKNQQESDKIKQQIKELEDKLAEQLKKESIKIPELGTYIKIINTGSRVGCRGAIGKIGVVTSDESNSGMLKQDDGFNVRVSNCTVWRINLDSEIEVITEEEYLKTLIPDIAINGYKAKFEKDRVTFGCAVFGYKVFIEAYQFMSKIDSWNKDMHCATNRNVTKITLGSGEFTYEQIKEIADYYKNKK